MEVQTPAPTETERAETEPAADPDNDEGDAEEEPTLLQPGKDASLSSKVSCSEQRKLTPREV